MSGDLKPNTRQSNTRLRQYLPDTLERDAYLGTLSQARSEAWFEALLGYITGGGPEGNRRPLTVELPDDRIVESGFREGSAQGCVYLGAEAIHGDYLRYEVFRQQVAALIEEAWDATLASDLVGQSVDAWSARMKRRGYDYDNPEEPEDEFAGLDVVSQAELQTAARMWPASRKHSSMRPGSCRSALRRRKL